MVEKIYFYTSQGTQNRCWSRPVLLLRPRVEYQVPMGGLQHHGGSRPKLLDTNRTQG